MSSTDGSGDRPTLPATINLSPEMVEGILSAVGEYNGLEIDGIDFVGANGETLEIASVQMAIRIPGLSVKATREESDELGPLARALADLRRSYGTHEPIPERASS